jgi:2-dehydropantoate 2-reductase
MRLLVVGAGATGGYYGGMLAKAGRDVTFLVRAKRAEQLRRDCLQIKSPRGDITVTPKLVTASTIDGPYDAVLLSVKAFALESSLADFAPAVGPDTLIAPVLNGMKHFDDLSARFGAKALIGGVAKVATMIDEAGRIVQLADFQELAYGELDGSASARTEALHAFMKDVGFEARLTGDIVLELWQKWIMLASMGGVTTLMRGTVGDIEAAPGGVEFVHAFLDEVVAITTKLGHPPTSGFLANIRTMLTKKGSPQATSMYRDLKQGFPIEADHIVGDLLARGRKAGVQAPLLAAAYAHLCVYQNGLRG